MKLKIISNGNIDTVAGTKVINEDTGELLEGVHYVEWSADVNNV